MAVAFYDVLPGAGLGAIVARTRQATDYVFLVAARPIPSWFR
jgi:hypothetical protein